MHELYLSLGTNLGDKSLNLCKAIENIEKLIGKIVCRSAFYVTEPWGFASENTFMNACVRCCTRLSPREVLVATQSIERDMGRKQKSEAGVYSDRIIDIDILMYDDVSINEPDLKIPHPLMHRREFVMKPLEEILKKPDVR